MHTIQQSEWMSGETLDGGVAQESGALKACQVVRALMRQIRRELTAMQERLKEDNQVYEQEVTEMLNRHARMLREGLAAVQGE